MFLITEETRMEVRSLARKKKDNTQISDKQRSLITYYDPKSPVSEQYRTIRTNIEFASVDNKIKTLMVTSSTPGEGKSTTTANLATVLGQQGKSVLVIDTDMRKPTVHFTFQLPNTSGLTNVITRQQKFDDSVYETSIPNVDVLTSGPIPPNPSELIGSRAMQHLIGELKEAYDYIVFDAPPVKAVADPLILSKYADGVVLVVRSGKTEEEAAKDAVDALKKAEANILGAVLNDVKIKDTSYYYYYSEK